MPEVSAIAITNAAGPVGRALCEGLSQRGLRVTGVGARTPDWAGSGIRWVEVDTSEPEVLAGITGASVAVHLECADDLSLSLATRPALRRSASERRARAVVTAAAAAGVDHLVLVTSAMVYGAHPETSAPLAEDTAIVSVPDEGLVGDMVTVEQVGDRAQASYPRLALTRLRPAALVGPGVDTVVTRQFEAPRLLTLRGHEMRWQFCHVEDLVTAVEAVIAHRLTGAVTVGADGWLDPAEIEQASGMRSLELPASLAFGTADRLHRVGVLPMPVNDLTYVVHPWVVASDRLRAAGWRPVVGNRECVQALIASVRGLHAIPGLRVTRKDAAALGVAGAAVALVGTAAVWRQARQGRGRR